MIAPRKVRFEAKKKENENLLQNVSWKSVR